MKRPKALLLGYHDDLLRVLSFLLFRAGFEITVIGTNFLSCQNPFVMQKFFFKKKCEIIKHLSVIEVKDYDLIVPYNEEILLDIKNSDLDLAKKLKILPVIDERNLSHLASKINLSYRLQEQQVLTPPFRVVKNKAEVVEAAQILGFPLLLKVDFSSGGAGVFECNTIDDIAQISAEKFSWPLLAQQKIFGREVDLSGFFQDGKLIHFSCSYFEKTISKFGPSFLRIYPSKKTYPKQVLFHMQKLGQALGADGFVNVSAIVTEAQEIYFFEADMRPNIWADIDKFLGDDAAPKIKEYFSCGAVMQNFGGLEVDKVVPNFLRLKIFQIICNKYSVWSYMSRNDWLWLGNIFVNGKIRILLRFLNRIPTLVVRFFLPQKEVRQQIKFKIKRVFLAA